MKKQTEIPDGRYTILALTGHDQATRAASAIGYGKRSDDEKLAELVTITGMLAACGDNSPFTYETLKRILGFTWGWLVCLGIDALFTRISAERDRQEKFFRAGKFTFTCASPISNFNRKLRVLVEEVGEVAQEIDLLENCHPRQRRARLQNFIEELTQVAAVVLAWLEAGEPPAANGKTTPSRITHHASR